MDALVFLLTTPTIGPPPNVWPLKPLLDPLGLLNGLELPGVVVPGVPVAVPDESVPVPVLLVPDKPVLVEGELMPDVGVMLPIVGVPPAGIPEAPPSTLLPAVADMPPF